MPREGYKKDLVVLSSKQCRFFNAYPKIRSSIKRIKMTNTKMMNNLFSVCIIIVQFRPSKSLIKVGLFSME